jgi:8-oxo-dGTP pyrophosphatase MutT (NUDIX family)
MSTWKTLYQKVIHKNPYFSLREDCVVKPNGKEGKYYVVEKHESVFMLPITDTGEIYLVKQFRYPTQTWSWEVPAGSTDGQEPLVAAQRELQEECGLSAASWEEVYELPVGPGLSNNIGHVYIARGLTVVGDDRQAEEGIVDCRSFSLDEIKKMIRSRELMDGPSLAALAITQWAI